MALAVGGGRGGGTVMDAYRRFYGDVDVDVVFV